MNNIDSIDEERQMRKDVKRLILEKQLMKKVMTDNTFHFTLSSIESRNHITNQQISAFEVDIPSHPKGHIKSARLRIDSIHFTRIDSNAITDNKMKNVNQFQPYISIVKNNTFTSRLETTTGGHLRTKNIKGITTSFPLVNHPNTGVATGNRTRSAEIHTDMWFPCDNPFGKTIRFELYNSLGAILDLGNTANHTCIFNMTIELLPDFNENDRINY